MLGIETFCLFISNGQPEFALSERISKLTPEIHDNIGKEIHRLCVNADVQRVVEKLNEGECVASSAKMGVDRA